MHVLTCTVASVLPLGERLNVRRQRHDGRFPFWPEHLGWHLAFDVGATATTRDVWDAARDALAGTARVRGWPDYRAVDIRRVPGARLIAPGSSLEVVVLAVTLDGTPRFQMMTAAAGCPVGFGRHPTATVRVRWPVATRDSQDS